MDHIMRFKWSTIESIDLVKNAVTDIRPKGIDIVITRNAENFDIINSSSRFEINSHLIDRGELDHKSTSVPNFAFRPDYPIMFFHYFFWDKQS